jgi:hypothetical protein
MKTVSSKGLLKDLRELIEAARQNVARQVNSALVLLYWRVGKRMRQDILKEKRGEYGEQIVATQSKQLTEEFGEGWSRYNLSRMIRFAECFPGEKIVATLSQQLGWSHFKEIIPLDDDLKREVFADVIADRAAAVIFLHNHPSGELQPSESVLNIHRQLTEAGRILGIHVLDHIIVTRKGDCSFQEAGLLAHER